MHICPEEMNNIVAVINNFHQGVTRALDWCAACVFNDGKTPHTCKTIDLSKLVIIPPNHESQG